VSTSGAKTASLAYDPLGRLYQVTSGATTTRYAYVGNDPLNRTDPMGLASYDCSGGIGTGNCDKGTELKKGDKVTTANGEFVVGDKGAKFISNPISRGTGSRLSTSEVTNIVFNETRSLSGASVDEARTAIAHTIINGDEARGDKRPLTAPSTASVPEAERNQYSEIQSAVLRARAERDIGHDPTGGAINFNFRNPSQSGPFFKIPPVLTIGPLGNSYPTTVLGPVVYAWIYRND
jgi:hypothetical protein